MPLVGNGDELLKNEGGMFMGEKFCLKFVEVARAECRSSWDTIWMGCIFKNSMCLNGSNLRVFWSKNYLLIEGIKRF